MRSREAVLATTFILLALAAGGCGDDEGEPSTSAGAPPTSSSASTTGERDASPAPAEAEGSTEIYFTSGEQFRAVERELPEDEPGVELTAAAEALIAGPTAREAATEVVTTSQIPPSTEVRGVQFNDRGVATIRLSPEFTTGIPKDVSARSRAQEAELDARLGQVTYTLTQFPQIEEAKVIAGGNPVEPQPTLDRSDYARPEGGPRRLERPKGESGSSVRRLQTRLAELRYLPKRAVDGVAGYRTSQAVIAFQSWRGLERDGIVGPQTSAALTKASPPTPEGDGPSRRIEVYREKGVALLIKGDRVKRAIHVSTGGPGNETPAGTFTVFRKELRSWSVPFQTWLPYASYFNNGIAFHEYPDVPTYPASHGCVRVPAPEAKGVYRFAAFDTTVVVL